MAHVWSVLTDFPRYAEWNPFTFGVECDGIIGHPVKLRVNLGGRRITMNERLTRYEEGHLVAWGLRWLGGFTLHCDRVQALTSIDPQTTSYISYEAFDGLLAGYVYRFHSRPVQAGFDANADAFVARCEATRP
jgi:hypothetical protein